MSLYETVFILDPQLKAPEIEEFVKKFMNFITNHGGEIVNKDEWGKRRLAYEINRKQYGYYVLLRFNGPGQIVALLEREYRLNEMVIRYLTIKVDPKALKMEEELERNKREQEKSESDEDASATSTALTDPVTEPESEAQPESEPETESEAEPEVQSETDLEPEPEVEPEAQPVLDEKEPEDTVLEDEKEGRGD